PPPTLQLFPYTTLFRSSADASVSDVVPRVGTRLRSQTGDSLTGKEASRMARKTIYCAQAFWVRRGRLVGGVVHQFLNEERALARSEEHTSELQSRENLV